MKTLLTILLGTVGCVFASSIYTRQFINLQGSEQSMSQYQGKKILIVNIASESAQAPVQIPQLQQLQNQFAANLVVIGFPTNDFGNEPRTNDELLLLMQNTYHVNFPVSLRTQVKDSSAGQHPVYYWLQHQSENGAMEVKVKKDFQKYLIDTDGKLIGVFSGNMSPLDTQIINNINGQ